jgi:hypothetical protein
MPAPAAGEEPTEAGAGGAAVFVTTRTREAMGEENEGGFGETKPARCSGFADVPDRPTKTMPGDVSASSENPAVPSWAELGALSIICRMPGAACDAPETPGGEDNNSLLLAPRFGNETTGAAAPSVGLGC